jgi:hypothetical protein
VKIGAELQDYTLDGTPFTVVPGVLPLDVGLATEAGGLRLSITPRWPGADPVWAPSPNDEWQIGRFRMLDAFRPRPSRRADRRRRPPGAAPAPARDARERTTARRRGAPCRGRAAGCGGSRGLHVAARGAIADATASNEATSVELTVP